MIAAAVVAGVLVLSVLLWTRAMLARSGASQPERRASLRLLVLGAAGLSLLPGYLLRARGAEADEGKSEGDLLMAKWARLGRIWREMSQHLKKQPGSKEGEAAFNKLRVEMAAALDALPAWPALRTVFEGRWGHIHRLKYVMATCYVMVPHNSVPVLGRIEAQVKELEELVASGRLTEEAAKKAAAALGLTAEFLVQYAEVGSQIGEERWKGQEKLWQEYSDRALEPSGPSVLAGQRLAEMTVDKLGWLAGPPKENEGDEQPGK